MKRIILIIASVLILSLIKVKAQSVRWLTMYNNKYSNESLLKNDTIYAKDYNNGEGLILYQRGSSDTLSFTQNKSQFHGVCASYLKWDKNDKYPQYGNTLIIPRNGLIIKNWTNYYPDHCSHMSHYSHYSAN